MKPCAGDARHSHVPDAEGGPACFGSVMPWEIETINDTLDEMFGASHEA